jgi:hypothetical protein
VPGGRRSGELSRVGDHGGEREIAPQPALDGTRRDAELARGLDAGCAGRREQSEPRRHRRR